MKMNNGACAKALRRYLLRFIISTLFFLVLLVSIDWLSLFLYKFLNSHRAAFWISICMNGTLFMICILKYRSIFRNIEHWFTEKDGNIISQRLDGYYFYFKRD